MSLNKKSKTRQLEVVRYALPAVFDELCTALTTIVDSKMISAVSVSCIAAVSVSTHPRLFIFALFSAVNIVIGSLTAFYFGRKDRDRANRLFITAAWAVLILSVVTGLLSIVLAHPIIDVCSGQKDTRDMAVTYFRITAGCMIFNNMFLLMNSALRGLGRTTTALVADVIANAVNILMNYLLIFGNCGFPALGIAGAAWGTVIGTAMAMLFDIIILFRESYFISIGHIIRNKISFDRECLMEIYDKWKHTVVENILLRVGILVSSSVTARIGSFETSIHSVCTQLVNISAAIGRGFQSAMVTLVGRSRGENNTRAIRRYSVKTGIYSFITAVIAAVLMTVFAEPYCRLFSSDPAFIEGGIVACLFSAGTAIIQIPRLAMTGFLQGMGRMQDTEKSAIISVAIVQTASSILFVLILKMGLEGAHIASLISHLVWFITTYAYYRASLPRDY